MCLTLVPSTHAFAQELKDLTTAPSPAPISIRETVRQMSFAQAAAGQERGRQSVATTTESKLMLGLATGGLIVGGMTMMAYGASSSCKGKETVGASGCERTALLGAVTFSGGAAMALLWALSRD